MRSRSEGCGVRQQLRRRNTCIAGHDLSQFNVRKGEVNEPPRAGHGACEIYFMSSLCATLFGHLRKPFSVLQRRPEETTVTRSKLITCITAPVLLALSA